MLPFITADMAKRYEAIKKICEEACIPPIWALDLRDKIGLLNLMPFSPELTSADLFHSNSPNLNPNLDASTVASLEMAGWTVEHAPLSFFDPRSVASIQAQKPRQAVCLENNDPARSIFKIADSPVRNYHTSASSFLHLVNDPDLDTQLTQRLRLQAASRKLRLPWLHPALYSTKGGVSPEPSSDFRIALDKASVDQLTRYWLPEPHKEMEKVFRLLNTPSHPRAIAFTEGGEDAQKVASLDDSLPGFKIAQRLNNATLQAVLQQIGEPNVPPSIHVPLGSMYHLCRNNNAFDLLDSKFPWQLVVTRRNTLLDSSLTRIEDSQFPIPEKDDVRPFPEDYAMRWSDQYFADNWFENLDIGFEESGTEFDLTSQRKERILWLACQISKSGTQISYDSEDSRYRLDKYPDTWNTMIQDSETNSNRLRKVTRVPGDSRKAKGFWDQLRSSIARLSLARYFTWASHLKHLSHGLERHHTAIRDHVRTMG
jgi:hypothetical protein